MKKVLFVVIATLLIVTGCTNKLSEKEYVSETKKILDSAKDFHEKESNNNTYGGIANVRQEYANMFKELTNYEIKGVEMDKVITFFKMMEKFEQDAHDLFITYGADKTWDDLSEEERKNLEDAFDKLYSDDYSDVVNEAHSQLQKLKEDKKISSETYDHFMELVSVV